MFAPRVPEARPSRSVRPAFTLVELLVVIGIIALLISILLPSLNSARRSANTVKCLSNQRQFGQAVTFFTQEHKGWMPKAWYNDYPEPAFVGNRNADWGFRNPLWGWDSVMYKYTDGASDIFRCPSDATDYTRGAWNDNGNYPDASVTPPNPGPTPQELKTDNLAASYRWNTSNLEVDWRSYKLTELVSAPQQIVLCDMLAKQPGNSTDAALHGMKSWDTDPNGAEAFGPLKTAARDQTRNCDPYRHTGEGKAYRTNADGSQTPIFKINAVFADGHGEAIDWDRTWEVIGEAKKFGTGFDQVSNGGSAVGVPTMWRQIFKKNTRPDTFDNPNTDADDANPHP